MSHIPEEIDENIQNELSTIDKNKLVELWHLYEEYYTDLLNYVPDKHTQSISLQEHAEKKFDTYIVELANSYMSKEQIETDIDNETKKFRVIKMMLAIRENRLEEVRQLYHLDNSLIFEKDKEKDTPILKACRICNAQEIVNFLLEKGAGIEDLDSIRQTPLIVASQHGCKDIVQKLLDAGANVHHKAEYSRNALITATEEGDVEIVKMLLSAGADPKEVNDVDETPQMIALRIHRGKPTQLSKLFEGGKRKRRTKSKKRRNKGKTRNDVKRKQHNV